MHLVFIILKITLWKKIFNLQKSKVKNLYMKNTQLAFARARILALVCLTPKQMFSITGLWQHFHHLRSLFQSPSIILMTLLNEKEVDRMKLLTESDLFSQHAASQTLRHRGLQQRRVSSQAAKWGAERTDLRSAFPEAQDIYAIKLRCGELGESNWR